MKILLGDFSAKIGKEGILKLNSQEWEFTWNY